MSKNKEEAVVNSGTITLGSKHLSLIAGAGVLYSALVFLSGYIVGHRKAAATLFKHFQTENTSSVDDDVAMPQTVAQAVAPAQCISLGYFEEPEQAHNLARWGEQTTDLSFKVCEYPVDDSDVESDGVLYHVISETCSNDVIFDAALRRLVPHQERPECNQFRLLTV